MTDRQTNRQTNGLTELFLKSLSQLKIQTENFKKKKISQIFILIWKSNQMHFQSECDKSYLTNATPNSVNPFSLISAFIVQNLLFKSKCFSTFQVFLIGPQKYRTKLNNTKSTKYFWILLFFCVFTNWKWLLPFLLLL